MERLNGTPADSLVDPDTLRAYRETEYRVFADGAFVLRIGEYSAALAALHARRRVRCSGFVTASNPQSRPSSEADNARRHEELRRELVRRGLPGLDGLGRHPTNGWPGEASFLVPGLARDEAVRLGARFDQNAIVWSDADAIPHLVLLR